MRSFAEQVVMVKKQTLTMPLHDQLDAGTLRAVFRQATHYVTENELRPHFYSE